MIDGLFAAGLTSARGAFTYPIIVRWQARTSPDQVRGITDDVLLLIDVALTLSIRYEHDV